MLLKPKRTKENIETRLADRAKSIFASFGTIVSDFYLEAGIYFVGGFNAALVAWDIYTDLVSKDQPLPYAITLAIIAFIAVEGLAVYLVGAAAKTNNGLLWFFSVLFAAFFTYAHYKEMSGDAGVISQYITLAIPFFVVVGYWARTLKVDTEMTQTQTQAERDEERARQRQLEDEARMRREKIEDEERAFRMETERLKTEAQNEVKRLKAAAQKSTQSVQKGGHLGEMTRSNELMTRVNEPRQTKKMDRQNAIVELVNTNPQIGPTELTKQLNELGYSTSVSTVKRDVRALNGKLKS